MPDRDYNINFNAPSDATIASLDALIGKLTTLDKLCDVVRPKLAKIATDASRSINATAKACDGLATNLSKVDRSATGAAGSVGKVAAQSVSAGRAAQQLRVHSDHATGAFGEWASKGLHLNATLLRVGYASLGIQSGMAVWKAFSESLHNAEEYARETAEHVIKLNDEIREMKVIIGGTAKEARENISKTILATGMDESQAKEFNTMWGSAVSGARKSGNWQLSDEETEKSRLEMGHFARQNHIDPAAFGKMVPLMGTVQPMKSADDVMREVGAVHKMGLEGAMTFTEMTKDLLKSEGRMVRPEGGGAFRSVAEVSAVTSALTAAMPPAQIPTALKQIWREGAAPSSEKTRENLARIGIKGSETSFPQALERYGEYLGSDAAKGKTQEQALKDLGIKSRGGPEAIIAAVKQQKVIKANLAEIGEASDPAKIRLAMEQADVESPHAMAQAALQVTRNRAGEPSFTLESLRPFAENVLEYSRGYQDEKHLSFTETMQGHLNASLGMEEPRRLNQNTVLREALLRVRPNAADYLERDRMGLGGEWSASSDLNEVFNQLTPEEKTELYRDLSGTDEGHAEPGTVVPGARAPAKVPVRPAAAGKGTVLAPPAAARPAAVGPTASLGLGGDSPIQAEQLRTLRMIERKLGGGGGGYGGVYLPTDGGDNGPLRMG